MSEKKTERDKNTVTSTKWGKKPPKIKTSSCILFSIEFMLQGSTSIPVIEIIKADHETGNLTAHY